MENRKGFGVNWRYKEASPATRLIAQQGYDNSLRNIGAETARKSKAIKNRRRETRAIEKQQQENPTINIICKNTEPVHLPSLAANIVEKAYPDLQELEREGLIGRVEERLRLGMFGSQFQYGSPSVSNFQQNLPFANNKVVISWVDGLGGSRHNESVIEVRELQDVLNNTMGADMCSITDSLGILPQATRVRPTPATRQSAGANIVQPTSVVELPKAALPVTTETFESAQSTIDDVQRLIEQNGIESLVGIGIVLLVALNLLVTPRLKKRQGRRSGVLDSVRTQTNFRSQISGEIREECDQEIAESIKRGDFEKAETISRQRDSISGDRFDEIEAERVDALINDANGQGKLTGLRGAIYRYLQRITQDGRKRNALDNEYE